MAIKKGVMAKKNSETKQSALSEEEEADLDLAVTMARVVMKSEKGMQAAITAASAKDPVQGIAQFVVMMIPQLIQQSSKKGLELSPNIFLAKDGFVSHIFDTIQALASQQGIELPFSALPAVEAEVAELVKASAMAEQQGGLPPAQPGMQPQGGMDPTAPAGPMPPMPPNGGMM